MALGISGSLGSTAIEKVIISVVISCVSLSGMGICQAGKRCGGHSKGKMMRGEGRERKIP